MMLEKFDSCMQKSKTKPHSYVYYIQKETQIELKTST